MPRYKRILLKLSGEVLAGGAGFGIDAGRVCSLAEEIAEVARRGVQLGLVIGAGNFFRGVAAAASRMDRVTADNMGMLATIINCLAVQDALDDDRPQGQAILLISDGIDNAGGPGRLHQTAAKARAMAAPA